MNVGEIVKWNHSNPEGWAGNGRARILRYDPERRYFGGPVGSGNPGPAVEIEIADPKRAPLTVWVSPAELEQLPAEAEVISKYGPIQTDQFITQLGGKPKPAPAPPESHLRLVR